jgi:Cdc6-like AAA superfamily ATPase
MDTAGVIRNPDALAEDFLPSRMFARDGQMQQMARCLEPLSDGRTPRNMLLYGPPGTGKTCMSRHVLAQLSEQASFSGVYVNCWNFETRFKILFTILQKIGADPSKHRVGTPIDEIIESLARKASARRVVVILDEADRIADERAVYDLISVGAGVMLVANDETAMYKWDQRIRSRLASAERVHFPKYRPDELEGILKDRAEWALVPGSISMKDMIRIAEAANGDARAAIAGLRQAAEKAEAAGRPRIAPAMSDVSGAKNRKADINDYQKAAVEILRKRPGLSGGELLEAINAKADEPLPERTFRKQMEELVRLGLVSSGGEGRWRRYGAA